MRSVIVLAAACLLAGCAPPKPPTDPMAEAKAIEAVFEMPQDYSVRTLDSAQIEGFLI